MSRGHRARKLLFGCAIGVVAAILSAVCLLAFLPRLVSTQAVRVRIEARASEALGRPLRLGGLSWSWSKGIVVQDLVLGDAPEFSTTPMLSVGRARLAVDLRELLRRRAVLDLDVKALECRFIRLEDGRSNWGTFLAALPKSPPSPEKEPSALPFDIAARVRVGPVSLEAEDQGRRRRVALREGSVSLDAPSLKASPVVLRIASGVEVDGRTLPDLAVSLKASRLFNASGALDPRRVEADVAAVLPGIRLSARARMAETALNASVGIDLAEVLGVVGPFLPSTVLPGAAEGMLDLDVSAAGDPRETVRFAVALTGSGLRAAGGILRGRRLGPLWFSVRNRGSFAPTSGDLEIARGELRFQERTNAAWTVRATRLTGPNRAAALELGPVSLDLQELLDLGRPFLPAGLAVELRSGRTGRPTLALARGRASGFVPAGPNPVHLQGLRLSVPDLRLSAGGRAVAVRGAALSIRSLGARLAGPSLFAEGSARLRLGSVRIAGPKPVELRDFDLEIPELGAAEFRKAGDAVAGRTGRLTLRETLRIGSLGIAGLGEVSELEQALDARVALQPQRRAELRVRSLSVAARAVRVDRLGEGAESLSFSLSPDRRGERASVSLRDARLSGTVGGGPGPVSLGALTVQVPSFQMKRGRSRVAGEGVGFTLSDAVAVLRGGWAESAGFRCGLKIRSLDLSGDRRASLRDLRIPNVSLSASDLDRSAAAAFGLTGKFSIRQTLSVGAVDLPGFARASGLDEALALDGHMGPTASFQLGASRFSAASLEVGRKGWGPFPLKSGVALEVVGNEIRFASRAAKDLDVDGLHAHLDLGGFARSDARLTAKRLGAERLSTAGELEIDLTRLPPGLLDLAVPDLQAQGAAALRWDFDGRLPRSGETPSDANGLAGGLPFLEGLEAILTVRDGLVRLPLAGGQAVKVAGLRTARPLHLRIGKSGASASLGGEVSAEVLEELPHLGRFEMPPRAALTLSLSQSELRSVRVSQQLTVEPLALRESFEADLTGVDRLLRAGEGAPWARVLRILGGTARASLEAGDGASGLSAGKGVSWSGPLAAAAEVRLAPSRDVSLRLSVDSAGTDVRLGALAAVRGLRAKLSLAKSYRLDASQERDGRPSKSTPLSQAVLDPAGSARLLANPPVAPTYRGLLADLRPQFRGRPSVSFDAAKVSAGGMNLDLSNGSVDLRLDHGLPSLEQFRLDLLGGTILGSADIARGEGAFPLRARIAFSGLDGTRLAPDLVAGVAGEEAELGGQVWVAAPLGADAARLLQDLDLTVEFTHIGASALDRFLFALDPNEANEALVKQRALLRAGSPRWVKLAVRRGNLSLTGELDVKGVRIGLPPIEQLNVAELPGREKLEKSLLRLRPLLEALRVASADTLEVGSSGQLRFSSSK